MNRETLKAAVEAAKKFIAAADDVEFNEHKWLIVDIQTHGKADGPQIRGRVTFASATEMPVWRHNKCGTVVEEIGRGELQYSTIEPALERGAKLRDGSRMVAYREQDGTIWFRLEAEFDDGRFTKA